MKTQEYQTLGEVIAALKTPQFTAQFIQLLKRFVTFDCAVILGYRQHKHPIYLYDSLPSQRQLLFQHYLTHSYRYDPFYVAIAEQHKTGILQRSEFKPVNQLQENYHTDFYQKTGWQDEVCIAVDLEDNRWIVIYLGMLQTDQPISQQQINGLKQRFPVLQALCRQHWGSQALFLAENSQSEHDLRHWVAAAIADFATDCLTPREQQITTLLVQGLDSQEIAAQLSISHGTVKNHRKRIYQQLQISSLSELFQLFLNHLITKGY
ncbi:MAG: helix-turn-helix transcriptional regulator [Vibrio metschnikovii]|uniref:response regulator transcription factor n=2 Tax=Bacteria TaxID=2 RepID=UPI001C2F65E9|nr:helix-turn-helix transcriptional regulator [Vibrio metschnikovii]MDM7484618.1 helix-turn-helix transcriptional regulator [Vibrio metschnikovii]